MFVDASALVAILLDEPEADALSDRLLAARRRVTSPIAVYETVLAVMRENGVSRAIAEKVVGFDKRADLPTYASVVAALADFPTIAAARANVRAQEAVRSALTAGPHEYALRLEGIERRERNVDVRYNEWNAIIERGVRLPGKSILDGRIGEESVAQAQSASGDAVHEAGRMLLRQWFAWMRAGATAAVWANQVGVLTIERDIVERRVRLGDAPRQEMLLAASAVAQLTVISGAMSMSAVRRVVEKDPCVTDASAKVSASDSQVLSHASKLSTGLIVRG